MFTGRENECRFSFIGDNSGNSTAQNRKIRTICINQTFTKLTQTGKRPEEDMR